jgi:hypothetical protein
MIIEINFERTHLSETISDYVLEASASTALTTILDCLKA